MIELEEGDTVIEGIGSDESGGIDEEPTDFLSHIIEVLNDSFDGDFSDEDKVKFEEIKLKILESEDLRQVMIGDNTETNKKDKFDRTIDTLILSLIDNNLDFYKKLKHKERNKFIKDKLYDEYSRSLRKIG